MNVSVIRLTDFLKPNTITHVIEKCLCSSYHVFRTYLNDPGNIHWLRLITAEEWIFLLKGMLKQFGLWVLGENDIPGVGRYEVYNFNINFSTVINFLFCSGNTNTDAFLNNTIINMAINMTLNGVNTMTPILTDMLMLLTNEYPIPVQVMDQMLRYDLYWNCIQIVKYAPGLELLAGQYNNKTNIWRATKVGNNYTLLNEMMKRIFLPIKVAMLTDNEFPNATEIIKNVMNNAGNDPKEGTRNYNQMWQILLALEKDETMDKDARKVIRTWISMKSVQDFYGLKDSKMHEG